MADQVTVRMPRVFGQLELLAEIVVNARASLTDHDAECSKVPHLVLLNPGNFELLRIEELLGMPVLPDDSVEPLRCKFVCGDDGVAGTYGGSTVFWHQGVPYVPCSTA